LPALRGNPGRPDTDRGEAGHPRRRHHRHRPVASRVLNWGFSDFQAASRPSRVETLTKHSSELCQHIGRLPGTGIRRCGALRHRVSASGEGWRDRQGFAAVDRSIGGRHERGELLGDLVLVCTGGDLDELERLEACVQDLRQGGGLAQPGIAPPACGTSITFL
jgi:hypothetical protein